MIKLEAENKKWCCSKLEYIEEDIKYTEDAIL